MDNFARWSRREARKEAGGKNCAINCSTSRSRLRCSQQGSVMASGWPGEKKQRGPCARVVRLNILGGVQHSSVKHDRRTVFRRRTMRDCVKPNKANTRDYAKDKPAQNFQKGGPVENQNPWLDVPDSVDIHEWGHIDP